MAVDLADLLPDFRAEINPPGTDLYATATNNDLIARLRNAFWEARLQGAFPNYREEDGEVTPITGDEDMPREHQQLIILLAGMNVVLAGLRNVQSSFRAKAGPVEYETAQSAQLLREVLATLKQKMQSALSVVLFGQNGVGNTDVFDAMISRTEAMSFGEVWYVR